MFCLEKRREVVTVVGVMGEWGGARIRLERETEKKKVRCSFICTVFVLLCVSVCTHTRIDIV